MYFIYVDESGDTGLVNSPSRYFALSGLVLHELVWHSTLGAIVAFRRGLKMRYGFRLRDEIHAGTFLHRPGQLQRIPKSLRLRLLRDVLQFEAALSDINIINVVVDKLGKPANYDVFRHAWAALAQRFHNTISYQNFPGPKNPQDHGLLVVDRTDEKKLRDVVRRMRHYNPVPNRHAPGYRQVYLTTLVEDPVHRDSHHSYFVQLADVNAYFLQQRFAPCGFVRKKGARNYLSILNPVLCTVASRVDPQGIVML